MSQQSTGDEALKDLAISQARNGQIESARQTASRISDHHFQRWAWMGILYAQFFESMDLRDVKVKGSLADLEALKQTLALLPDDSLWYGSWVPDLFHALVNAGDTAGAIEIVGKLKEPMYRGIHYGDIAGMVALKNDCDRVERIINLVSEDPEKMMSDGLDMVDMVLGNIARQHAWVGRNLERARHYATRISGEKEREWVLRQIEHPPLWASSHANR